ncbi:MAG: CHAP domain-containing protein [Pseudoxanthomonas sp.]|nr:CHAP domain-containing protein [Pseudoxanthomonas sp.]
MTFARHVGIPYTGERFCAVLAAQVLAEAGIPWPDVDEPAAAIDWQRVERPRPYDVVVFTRAGQPAHVGVCTGKGRFLHVEEGATSRIELLSSPLHARRVEGFYRYTPRTA